MRTVLFEMDGAIGVVTMSKPPKKLIKDVSLMGADVIQSLGERRIPLGHRTIRKDYFDAA